MSILAVLSVRCRDEKKTPDEEPARGLIVVGREDLVSHYEELRLQALGQMDMARGLGLALFLRQGMRPWIESWSKCPPPPRPMQEASTGHSIPRELQDEITNILAGMVLSSRSWEVNQ